MRPAPLNGQKNFHLLLKNSTILGVKVDVKCNPYFQLKGIGPDAATALCINGTWKQNFTAECTLSNRFCYKNPPKSVNNATLVHVPSAKVKVELAGGLFEFKYAYARAFYMCNDGFKFQMPSRIARDKFEVLSVSCLGDETWEKLPVCVV